MIGIDTNVLVRFLVDDDVVQNAAARRLLSERTAEDPAYVSAVALVETVWILHSRLKFPMLQITAILRDLLAADGLIVEHTEELDALLSETEPNADLADYLICWSGMKMGCRATKTFDRSAAKAIPGMELLT
ncbi:type II toxin-antitoxin system VapC family toxin [Rhizobium sp. LjRoot30]|uniref:PIN domain-containing protein n=1 Tax=Rhizobium sp. LjRoot30 TaxID=3342320 RepID=UPI003ECE8BA2